MCLKTGGPHHVAACFGLARALLATTGCSIKKFAINKLGDSLANSGTTPFRSRLRPWAGSFEFDAVSAGAKTIA